MTIEEKIRLCKAILLRIYKKEREDYKKKHGAKADPYWEKWGIIVQRSVFSDFDEAQLIQVIFPYLKEQGLVTAWSYDDTDYEFDFTFNPEVMESLREPLEKSKATEKTQVEFNDLLGTLTYKSYSYKPTKEYQKRAMRELWTNRKDLGIGKKGEPLPLHTFGSRIEFDRITSATKFQMLLKDDEKFEEKFRNFYKSIRKSIVKEIPVSIEVSGSGILMTVSEPDNT